jgi:hypothetical protein
VYRTGRNKKSGPFRGHPFSKRLMAGIRGN